MFRQRCARDAESRSGEEFDGVLLHIVRDLRNLDVGGELVFGSQQARHFGAEINHVAGLLGGGNPAGGRFDGSLRGLHAGESDCADVHTWLIGP